MSGVDGSNVADSHPSSLPVIRRNGRTFASHDVHTKMTDLFLQCVEDCWMTVKEVPEVVLRKVFELVRTLYQWDPREEEAIFDEESVWHQMCAHWDTEKWKKKSATGKKNRSSTDESGVISSHTGGSIGTAEHRDRLVRSEAGS
ncbi:hypothetical protein L2E82_47096 [Cichorium intybus]|uniref:Uncharacterized protein n=1 Tax=Cichorium intybus TaxID=13427 RepID=A0ACB8YUE4_CICIN|nr:hypothetical protein L2E82_47096 [Cichorium intybus]